jgi:hypothetical protein
MFSSKIINHKTVNSTSLGYGGLLVFKGWYIFAERSKVSTVFTRSEIVGSNSTRVMEV